MDSFPKGAMVAERKTELWGGTGDAENTSSFSLDGKPLAQCVVWSHTIPNTSYTLVLIFPSAFVGV